MDIREILAAIDEKDKQLWSNCRTNMRKVYIAAHNKVIGVADWSHIDDAFLDMIDIQLAQLFDRSGRLNSTKTIVNNEDAEKIKAEMLKRDNEVKDKLPMMNSLLDKSSGVKIPMSDCLPKNEWK